jgi:hypothetical protein
MTVWTAWRDLKEATGRIERKTMTGPPPTEKPSLAH